MRKSKFKEEACVAFLCTVCPGSLADFHGKQY